LFNETFGPIVAIRAGLDGTPHRRTQLDRSFAEAITRWNVVRAAGRIQIAYEYLLVVARRAA
jgi:hypothetical protein